MMSPDYWEVGASGRRYVTGFPSCEQLEGGIRQSTPTQQAGKSWDHECRRLGSETYLLTYRLRQGDRLTRRVTIWLNTPEGWRILYHQGTIVSSDEEDATPSES